MLRNSDFKAWQRLCGSGYSSQKVQIDVIRQHLDRFDTILQKTLIIVYLLKDVTKLRLYGSPTSLC